MPRKVRDRRAQSPEQLVAAPPPVAPAAPVEPAPLVAPEGCQLGTPPLVSEPQPEGSLEYDPIHVPIDEELLLDLILDWH